VQLRLREASSGALLATTTLDTTPMALGATAMEESLPLTPVKVQEECFRVRVSGGLPACLPASATAVLAAAHFVR
jgi:hypothetical protein